MGEENASLRLFMMNNTTNKITLILQTAQFVFFMTVNWKVHNTRHSAVKPSLSSTSLARSTVFESCWICTTRSISSPPLLKPIKPDQLLSQGDENTASPSERSGHKSRFTFQRSHCPSVSLVFHKMGTGAGWDCTRRSHFKCGSWASLPEFHAWFPHVTLEKLFNPPKLSFLIQKMGVLIGDVLWEQRDSTVKPLGWCPTLSEHVPNRSWALKQDVVTLGLNQRASLEDTQGSTPPGATSPSWHRCLALTGPIGRHRCPTPWPRDPSSAFCYPRWSSRLPALSPSLTWQLLGLPWLLRW